MDYYDVTQLDAIACLLMHDTYIKEVQKGGIVTDNSEFFQI